MGYPTLRRQIAFLLCLSGCALALKSAEVHAQSATLSGSVTDASNGRSLAFVNIVLQQEGRTITGTTSNADGLFLIPRLESGQYALRASFIGYETFADTLQLAPGEVRTYNIVLRPAETTLDEVVVESELTGGAADITAGRQTIRPADIELIPAPDLSADLVTYLATLPGVVTTGDRGGQLFIRGGDPSQNQIRIDGITVFQPFHILGFYSAFPADIISQTDLYAGGAGARFGDHLSSVIDVASRSGNNRHHAGAVTLSPFISSARLEGPLFTEHASFLFSARQSLVEQGAQHVIRQDLPFIFGDLFARLHAQPSPRARLSLTALHTYDRGTLGETVAGAESEELRWQNDAVGLRYLVLPRVLPVIAGLHVSYAKLRSELGPAGNPVRTSAIDDIRVALDASFPGERIAVDAGWNVDIVQFTSELGGLYQNVDLDTDRLNHIAFYVEPEFTFGNVRVRPGARMQFYFAVNKAVPEPRLRVIWDRGIHQISGAAGLYLQEFVGLADRRDASSVFTAWTGIPQENEDLQDNPLQAACPGRCMPLPATASARAARGKHPSRASTSVCTVSSWRSGRRFRASRRASSTRAATRSGSMPA